MRESKVVSIDEIRPNPYQPRVEFDDEALMELSQSIRENGLIHPITVRKENDGYEIVAGERRYRAMKIAGMLDIPVIVIDADEVQMAEMALVENIQRENLSAIEEAKAYVQIMKTSGISQSQLALKVGKSQSAVANKIRLLQAGRGSAAGSQRPSDHGASCAGIAQRAEGGAEARAGYHREKGADGGPERKADPEGKRAEGEERKEDAEGADPEHPHRPEHHRAGGRHDPEERHRHQQRNKRDGR